MFRFGDPGGRIFAAVGAANANILAHWNNVVVASGPAAVAITGGAGRLGNSCYTWNLNNTGGVQNSAAYFQKTFDSQPTWGVALAFKLSAIPVSLELIRWTDSGTLQVELRIDSTGAFYVTRNGTLLPGSSAGALVPLNTWVHVEFKVTIHPSAGVVGLWVNGVQRLNMTAQNTRTSASSSANILSLGEVTSTTVQPGTTLSFDDVIVYDAQATDANGFADITGPIGDCGLVWLLPAGAGTTTQWTPDSGANYARVNEATPDGDTSYVGSSTIGQIDTYALADLAGSVSQVKTVAQLHFARKDDVGSRAMSGALRSAGANTAHATQQALSNSYQYIWSTWGQNPNAGSPINWTVAAVNALEVGQQVMS